MKNKPKPLDLEEIREGLEAELKDIEEDLKRFREDEKFFGKEGVDYYYKQELISRRKEVLNTIKLVKEIKQRINSACEFYLRYKDRPELLIKEHPEYLEELKKKCMPRIEEILSCIKLQVKTNEEVFVVCYEKYTFWLFRLAFRGVLDDE